MNITPLKEIQRASNLEKYNNNGLAKVGVRTASAILEETIAATLKAAGGQVKLLHHTHESGCDLVWTLRDAELYIDVKACRASEYNNNIFLEREAWGKESNHFSDPRKNKYLAYVDLGNGKTYLIETCDIVETFGNRKTTSTGPQTHTKGYTTQLVGGSELNVRYLCQLK